MACPPYRGRTPVFVGDDLTDEDGFGSVNALGGHAIRRRMPAPLLAWTGRISSTSFPAWSR